MTIKLKKAIERINKFLRLTQIFLIRDLSRAEDRTGMHRKLNTIKRNRITMHTDTLMILAINKSQGG